MPKSKELQIYLQGDWKFPAQIAVQDGGVMIGTTHYKWDQVDILIKMLRTAKSIGKKQRKRLNAR